MAQEAAAIHDDPAHATQGTTTEAATDPRVIALLDAIARDRWSEAIEALDTLQAASDLELDNDDQAVFHACRALALGRMGRFDEAAELLRTQPRAERLRDSSMPNLMSDWLAWAVQLHDAQRFADEAAVVDAARDWPLAPPWRARWLLRRLLSLSALGRTADLLEPARELVAFGGDDDSRTYARFFLAFGLEAAGERDAALTAAEQALDALPTGPDRQLLLLLAARMLIALERLSEALDRLAEIEREHLDSSLAGEPDFWKAVALWALDRSDEALEAAALARGAGLLEVRKPDLAWRLGLDAAKRGHHEEAVHHFDEALASPDKGFVGGVRLARGQALSSLGRFGEAYQDCVAAAAAAPEPIHVAWAWLQAGRAAEAAGTIEDAAQAAEAALTAIAQAPDGDQPRAFRGGAWLLRARLALRQNDSAAALRAAAEAEQAHAPLADDLDLISLCWQAALAAHDLAQARAIAQAALQRSALADHPFLHFLVWESARRMGDGDAALAAARRGEEVAPAHRQNAKAWFGAALSSMLLGHRDKATVALEQLQDLDPAAKAHPVVEWLGVSLRMQTDQSEHSETDLAIVERLSRQPGDMAATFAMVRGMLLLQLGRWADADAVLAGVPSLMSSSPASDPSVLVQAHTLRFRALVALDRRDEAVAALQESCDVDPGDAPTALGVLAVSRTLLATLRSEEGRHEDALDLIRSAGAALRKLPSAMSLDSLFWAELQRQATLQQAQALIELRRFEEALATLRPTAKQADRFQALALHLMGRCHIGLQDWHAALLAQPSVRRAADLMDDKLQAARLCLRSALDEAAVRIRLREFDAAVQGLQQAIERDPDAALDSAPLWLLLGIAYLELQRIEPARAALERARGAAQGEPHPAPFELRQGIAIALSAALVKAQQYDAALKVIDDAPDDTTHGAVLGYNRGVAAIELFRKTKDPAWLARAREAFKAAANAGSELAAEAQRRIAARTDASTPWFDFWFGASRSMGRRLCGSALLALAAAALFVAPAWDIWQGGQVDWKLLPAPALGALLLLLIPGMKNLSLSWGEMKMSAEPSVEATPGAALVIPELSPVLDSASSVGRTFDAMSMALSMGVGTLAVQPDRAVQAFGVAVAYTLTKSGPEPVWPDAAATVIASSIELQGNDHAHAPHLPRSPT